MTQLCHRHSQEENTDLPAAERKLVKSQPKTTTKQVCNELEAAGRQLSVSTVSVFYIEQSWCWQYHALVLFC